MRVAHLFDLSEQVLWGCLHDPADKLYIVQHSTDHFSNYIMRCVVSPLSPNNLLSYEANSHVPVS
jgi:hypothetical protein